MIISMITLPAEIRYVRLASLTAWKVAEIFAESLNAKQLDEDFCHSFELSVSEAFSNSVFYSEPAEPSEKENVITISFYADNNKLTAIVTDTNSPFYPDPPSPNISAYPEKGFGLLLIHQLMDTVSYTRENGTNRISMTKQADCTQNQIQ